MGMSYPTDLQRSVQQIRRRLFVLLLQAFAAVVLLTVFLLLALFSLFLSTNRSIEAPLTDALQIYYLGRGSWEGISALPEALNSPFLAPEWQSAIVLDETGRVLVDQGRSDTPFVGQVYPGGDPEQQRLPLYLGTREIGAVVIRPQFFIGPFGFVVRLLAPVGFLSIGLGLMTVLIGLLLSRRVVTPLAEVIAAAQAVRSGDLSARVREQGPDALRGLTDSFNRMAEALERNDRERRNWLADIAHELRTPLTIMRGRLEGIVDGVYAPDVAQVAPALEQTYLLERLVEDLRLLTLVEAGQLPFDRKPIEMGDLARRVVEWFEAQAADNQVTLNLQVEPDLPPVEADPQRVEQVIGNLLDNSLRYVSVGGRIEVTVRRAANGVELAVSDNGAGVPETDLPRLFDRFWRAEGSHSRSAGGAGLGLAIAKHLVAAQGGSIKASLNPGGGLQIAFVLR